MNDVIQLAKEGVEIHGKRDPEYIVCAEVLRLHDVNQELLDVLRNLTAPLCSSLTHYHKYGPDWTHKDGTEVFEVSILTGLEDLIDASKAAIAKATGESNE